MPFIPLAHDGEEIILGMWKVEEEEQYFLDRLNIYENEKEILASISHPLKRLEWLSSRLCLKMLLNINYKVESLNHRSGKPYLSDFSHHISYSHSNYYAAAIAGGRKFKVSIDLEDLNKKRNFATSRLFMSPAEKKRFEESEDPRDFFLTWSSKETLYKMYEGEGLIFRENLIINPDGSDLQQKGVIRGIIHHGDHEKEYPIYYRFYSDVLLTYTFDAE